MRYSTAFSTAGCGLVDDISTKYLQKDSVRPYPSLTRLRSLGHKKIIQINIAPCCILFLSIRATNLQKQTTTARNDRGARYTGKIEIGQSALSLKNQQVTPFFTTAPSSFNTYIQSVLGFAARNDHKTSQAAPRLHSLTVALH